MTKNLIVNYLKEKRIATVDDLLTEIYTKLVNSHRPGMEAINTVLNKYCVEVKSQKSKKLGYRLRTEKETIDNIMTKKVDYQIGIFGSEILADGIGHNEIIKFLSNFAFELGKKVHVGETEQRKEIQEDQLRSQQQGEIDNVSTHKQLSRKQAK